MKNVELKVWLKYTFTGATLGEALDNYREFAENMNSYYDSPDKVEATLTVTENGKVISKFPLEEEQCQR